MKHNNLQKRAAWLFLWCLMLSTIMLAAPAAHAGLFGISQQEEIEAGQRVAQQAYKEIGKPLPSNHPMSRRVRVIGKRFAALSRREEIPYSYQVLKNDKVLNAFAAPGGPVFVTTKLMNTVSNDAELAYVLGHETAHIDRKHIVNSVERQQKVSLGVGILGAIFGYNDSDLFNVFSNVAFTVWSQGYSRDQESEADKWGVRWMSQLGFDPEAALTMLKKLDTGGGGGTLDKYLSSHPNPKDRENDVRKQIAEENLEEVARKAGGPSLKARKLPAFDGVNKNFNEDIYSAPPSSGHNFRPIIAVQNGDYKIVLVAVRNFADWADARIQVDGNVVRVSRGNNSIRMREGSRNVVINGLNRNLSVPAQIHQGDLYAPIGNVVAGVGGSVSWDPERHGVNVSVGNKKTFWELQEWG